MNVSPQIGDLVKYRDSLELWFIVGIERNGDLYKFTAFKITSSEVITIWCNYKFLDDFLIISQINYCDDETSSSTT